METEPVLLAVAEYYSFLPRSDRFNVFSHIHNFNYSSVAQDYAVVLAGPADIYGFAAHGVTHVTFPTAVKRGGIYLVVLHR